VGGERGVHSAAELLRAATAGGHRCLGWPEAGRLEAGALADLVTVGLDGVRVAGTRAEDALEAVVFGAAAADVTSVVASGRRVVRDGAHLGMDVPRELESAIVAAWA
jgi:cytosine/adenosine deaminase-related metal-dependent hydrolase